MSNKNFEAGRRPTALHFFLFAVTPRNIEDLRRQAGDAMFDAITRACASWTEQNKSRPPSQRAICVDCDSEFDHPFFPPGFAVTIPATSEGVGIVSGICAGCMAKPDLKDRTMRRLRALWPDAREAEWGRA